MDREVHMLIVLLVLQYSLLIILETLSTEQENSLVFQWHQLCCVTMALQG